jgi:hypothetical protein
MCGCIHTPVLTRLRQLFLVLRVSVTSTACVPMQAARNDCTAAGKRTLQIEEVEQARDSRRTNKQQLPAQQTADSLARGPLVCALLKATLRLHLVLMRP